MNHSSLKASSVPAGVSCWISSHRCSTSCVGPILACCNSVAICVTLYDPVCDPVTICVASRITLWSMLLCSGRKWWWCVRLILVATLWPSVWPCVTLCVILWPAVWLPDLRFGACCYAMEVMMMCEAHPCCNSGTICVKFSFGNFETKSSSINQFLCVTSQWPSPTRFWMNFTTYSCESTKLVRSLTWER